MRASFIVLPFAIIGITMVTSMADIYQSQCHDTPSKRLQLHTQYAPLWLSTTATVLHSSTISSQTLQLWTYQLSIWTLSG